MTDAEEQRQRERRRGRYAKYPTCRGCGKTVSPDKYASHPRTDCKGDDGVEWHDIAIVLCKECEIATRDLTNVRDFKAYMKIMLPVMAGLREAVQAKKAKGSEKRP